MLTMDGIHFSYHDNTVLKGVDLAVSEGEIVGLAGPNGSGKTTALRLISGALRPTRGRICIDEFDLGLLSIRERGKLVSVVPQDPQLPLGFSVLDLVLMGRTPHLKFLEWEKRSDYSIAIQAMESTGIAHLANRSLQTLSGGERQRSVIAMALTQNTPVLLLDEPTSSLDMAHEILVMEMLRRLHRNHQGIVLVAMHDLTLAARYCSRVVMLSEGLVHADGEPGEVITEENIFAVYGIEALVTTHPEEGTPVVLPSRSIEP